MLGRVPRAVGRRLAPRLNLSDTVLALGISPLGLPPTPCDLTLVADHGHDLPMVKLTRPGSRNVWITTQPLAGIERKREPRDGPSNEPQSVLSRISLVASCGASHCGK